MRVAVCLSGHLRTYRKTLLNLQRHLLNNREHQFDLFVHTWDRMGWYETNDADAVHDETASELPYLMESLRPKAVVVEPKKEFLVPDFQLVSEHQIKPGTNGAHILSMYYKVQECDKLRRQAESKGGFIYDAVVRARPDLVLENNVPLSKFELLDGVVYINDRGHSGGVNDQFAVANSATMSVYAACFENVTRYVDEGCEWRPEPILHYHLDRNNIQIKTYPFRIKLLRPNGTFWINKGTIMGKY